MRGSANLARGRPCSFNGGTRAELQSANDEGTLDAEVREGPCTTMMQRAATVDLNLS